MRPDLVTDLKLQLNPTAPQPLPTQITAQIRSLIQAGIITAGDHLPSTRMLAEQLSVARGTVVAAYELLAAEGLTVSAHGSGTRINPNLAAVRPRLIGPPTPAPARTTPQRALVPLIPGIPDTHTLVDSTWRAAWRTACTTVATMDTETPLGSHQLRTEISTHLRHMRGLVVDPEHIIVTAGARDGLALLLQALGPSTIGVESPGYPSLRRVPVTLGHTVIDIQTDSHGINPKQLENTKLDALLVTPSHQYPSGGSLSGARRVALTSWAHQTTTLIIEDDFDSELRYVGQPLPALTALAPDHTVLLGTFSSVLSPTIACGYLVVPPPLLPQLTQLRSVLGPAVGSIPQQALAHYLASGALRRRTQRLRRVYRHRRDLVISLLADAPGCQLRPITGGLHAVLLCEAPAHDVVKRCAHSGIQVTALQDYWGGEGEENGIVFGFGCHDDDTLDWALNEIRYCVSASGHDA
ncbi:MAG: PLP-dependent aminotransferase family protein [Corynebacterium sp.]|nr:PLP-dependent aminotransferase family protein [Corynebacterium sp.]